MNKPEKCCHPNCFKCPYDDCINENIYTEDYIPEKIQGIQTKPMSKKLEVYYKNRTKILKDRKKKYKENPDKYIKRAKEYYQLNKDKGLKERNRLNIQRIRAERQEKGLCIDCGKERLPNNVRCELCRDKMRMRNKQYRDRLKERNNGLCTD